MAQTQPNMRWICWLLVGAWVCLSGCAPRTHPSAPPSGAVGVTMLPGRQADGAVLLPNQWSLRPAGRQIELGDFPVNLAVHPSGRFAAVLHSGYSTNQVIIVDLPAGKTVSAAEVGQAFYGLEFSRDGKEIFCSGA